MSSAARSIQQTLQRCIAGPGPGDQFMVRRERSVGEPAAWREVIGFRTDETQSYSRLRSMVDDPGAAIGEWRAPPEPQRAVALAQAILASNAWGARPSRQMVPGGDLVAWTCATPEGSITYSAISGDPVSKGMAELDALLRRIAVDLQKSGLGASLRIEARLEGASVRFALLNEGRTTAVLQNPFRAPPEERSYFRLESAPLPPEVEGFTTPEPAFAPAAGTPTPDDPSLWNGPHVPLRPGVPLVLSAPRPAADGHVFRVVLSDYRPLEPAPDGVALQGRVFSNLLGLP